jgi:hypothetical protein
MELMSDFWDRFKGVVRSEWNSVFSDDGADAFSDDEALREAQDAAEYGVHGPSTGGSGAPASLDRPSVQSAFRLLDLLPSAGLEEVRAAYFELARHYQPLVSSGNAERASNARTVIFALTEAYEVLCEHLVPLTAANESTADPA